MQATIDSNPTDIANYSAYALILYKANRLSLTDSLLVNTFLGEYIYKDRRFEEAVPVLRSVIDQYRNLPHSESEGATIGAITLSFVQYKQLLHSNIVALGNCQIELEDYESAIKTLESSFSIINDNAPAWGYYGIALGYLGDIKGAARAFLYAMTYDPEIIAFWKNLKSCYENLGIKSENVELVILGITENPLNKIESLLFSELLSSGEFEKAGAVVNQLNPHDSNSILALANFKFAIGNYDLSIEIYKRALKIVKYSYPYYALARSQSVIGEFKDAKKNAKKALKLDKTNNKAWNLLKLLEQKKLTATQKASILWIREVDNIQSDLQFSLEAIYLVDLEVPTGFTVKDVIRTLAQGQENRFTNQNQCKGVYYTIEVTRDQQITINPLRNMAGAEKFKEPLLNSFEVYSIKRSENIDFRKLSSRMNDLVVNGDHIVVCHTYTPMPVKLVIAALEQSIVELAEPILRNWDNR